MERLVRLEDMAGIRSEGEVAAFGRGELESLCEFLSEGAVGALRPVRIRPLVLSPTTLPAWGDSGSIRRTTLPLPLRLDF